MREHKSENIHDALQFLEDEWIEEVDSLRNGKMSDKKENGLRSMVLKRKWVAIAAGICVIILAGSIWNYSLGGKLSLDVEKSDEIYKENILENNTDPVDKEGQGENEFFENCENMNSSADKEQDKEKDEEVTEDTETEE